LWTYSSRADSASSFAQFDLALNVELHLVGELERLEEGVGEHGGAGALGVLGGDKRVGEELGLEGAAVDVGQFDALLAVAGVRHALADAHVKVWVAVHGHHQGHCLADLHQAVGGGGERTTSNLQFAINIELMGCLYESCFFGAELKSVNTALLSKSKAKSSYRKFEISHREHPKEIAL
jgi:hypothetical protein